MCIMGVMRAAVHRRGPTHPQEGNDRARRLSMMPSKPPLMFPILDCCFPWTIAAPARGLDAWAGDSQFRCPLSDEEWHWGMSNC